MIKNYIINKILSSTLGSVTKKGGKKWLIVLAVAVALAFADFVPGLDAVEEFADSALAIACDTGNE
jgi:hypothetical protein